MPIYEYRCQECGHVVEKLVRGGQEPKVQCPQCGSPKVHKAISLFSTCSAAKRPSASASSEASCAPSG